MVYMINKLLPKNYVKMISQYINLSTHCHLWLIIAA